MLKVYGHAVLPSRTCNNCQSRYFVVEPDDMCCEIMAPTELDNSEFKVVSETTESDEIAYYGNCTYCDKPITDSRDAHLDHFYPWSLGGSNDSSNLNLSCGTCNSMKRDKVFDSVKEVRRFLQNRRAEKALEAKFK